MKFFKTFLRHLRDENLISVKENLQLLKLKS